ncbi:uncharacterized protein LOC121394237 [Xenopus laevis]|uniref:Uncharacterized protein LOC121394237 n=1 Tax=Xenopus laevis TaxID=8355 RepID=A0A8J1KTB3_XENLA|nr:uncharacterized protein LOC121394237 [Xenopus laevis]
MAEENPDGRLRDILRWIQAEAGHEDIQTLLQQCQLASSSTTAVTSLPTAEPPGSPSEEAASSSGADVAIQRTPASRGPGKKRIVAVKRNTRGKQAAKKRTQVTSAVSAKKRIVADPPQTGVWPSASPPSSRVSSAAVASGGPLQQKRCNALGPFPSTGSGGGPAAGSSYVGHQVGRGPQSRPEPGPSSCNTIGHPVLPPASVGHALPSSAIHSAPQPAGFTPQEESQPIQVIVQRALGNRQLFGQRRNTMPPTSVEFSIARISKWLSMSLADKTWHAYIASWNEWMKFKTSFPKDHYQGDSDVLLSFVLEQVEAQYSLSAITKKLAGISFFLKVQVSPPLVWIIGHSFVHRARARAEQRTYTTNLGIKDVRIVWMGIRGLKWPDLLPIILQMKSCWGFPAIILIHLAGNDIGKGRNIDLIRNIKRDLAQIRFIFPNTVIMWSEVVPRLVWLQDAGFHPLERCRKKRNFAISKFSKTVNILVYRHYELEQGFEGLYRADRVHLSDIGFDILNMGFQSAIERALHVWGMAKANVMV